MCLRLNSSLDFSLHEKWQLSGSFILRYTKHICILLKSAEYCSKLKITVSLVWVVSIVTSNKLSDGTDGLRLNLGLGLIESFQREVTFNRSLVMGTGNILPCREGHIFQNMKPLFPTLWFPDSGQDVCAVPHPLMDNDRDIELYVLPRSVTFCVKIFLISYSHLCTDVFFIQIYFTD